MPTLQPHARWLLALASLLLADCRKNIPIPQVTAPTDAATVARGEYLGAHLCSCLACHSPRDWTRWSGPADTSRALSGGENVGPEGGLGDGAVLHPPNLTPFRLASWSDGELVRAITTGMGKGDSPLFPAMPYGEFRALALDDTLALVAWLRTLPSAPVETPPRKLPFPLGLVVNAIPKPVELRATAPRPSDADYGSYVTHVAGCVWCHSAVDGRGQILPGAEFAGGHSFPVAAPGAGFVSSANLTPDLQTGIGVWTKEVFLARFRGFDVDTLRATALPAGSGNTLMPWSQLHDVTEQDLGAIYDYLRTLPPVSHAVVKFTPKLPAAQ